LVDILHAASVYSEFVDVGFRNALCFNATSKKDADINNPGFDRKLVVINVCYIEGKISALLELLLLLQRAVANFTA
jgi:hypothetical protein